MMEAMNLALQPDVYWIIFQLPVNTVGAAEC